jgi:hypothetical protein
VCPRQARQDRAAGDRRDGVENDRQHELLLLFQQKKRF